jgi:uncharacterized protein (TIGR02001 family)
MMRLAVKLAVAALLSLISSPASAQVALSGEANMVSDYRDRGISLSDGNTALQVNAEMETGNGWYLGGFGSWTPHGLAQGAVELSPSIGYRRSVADALTIDGSIGWYHYPDTSGSDYAEVLVALGWESGGTSAIAGGAWAPPQPALVDSNGTIGDNLYGFLAVEQSIAGTPISLTLGAGYEKGPFDGAARGGKLDWQLGAAILYGRLNLSASVTGAWRSRNVSGKRRGERGLVVSLGQAF